MPPIKPNLAIVGKVGRAAAPAAALQSRAEAPAPAADAAPWPTVVAPFDAVQTSSDPPLAGSICPAVPLAVVIRPAVPGNVRWIKLHVQCRIRTDADASKIRDA